MADLKEFLEIVREYNKRNKIDENSTYAERLKAKLKKRGQSNDEYLALREEVVSFLKSDASEADKEMVCEYTEMLYMICSGIEQGLRHSKNQQP